MSLAVIFKGPEGIVLAADSRVTLTNVGQVMVGTREAPSKNKSTTATSTMPRSFWNFEATRTSEL